MTGVQTCALPISRIRLKERKQSAADLQQLKSDAELDSEWEKVEREEA